MTTAISDSWIRIENWLARHAPSTHAALAPPADPADIAAAEAVIGRPLPQPLVESLSRHDGLQDWRQILLPPFHTPMTARQITDGWRSLTRFYDERGAAEREDGAVECGGNAPVYDFGLYGHPQLIPFAVDCGGDHLVLDDRPGSDHGRVLEATPVEGVHRGRHTMWTSLPVLMADVADALETGRALDHYTRGMDEAGRLDWDF